MDEVEEITGKLDEWYREQVTQKEFIIWGKVYSDTKKRFNDGEIIHTSGIRNRKLQEGDLVRTRNSIYLLGKEKRKVRNED